MLRQHEDSLSFDQFDEIVNPRPEECDFDRVVEAAISRRGFLGGVLAFGSVAALASVSRPAMAAANRFAFEAIPANSDDAVTVPAGYKARVMLSWGDPLFSGAPGFDHATRGTATSQAQAFGDNLDGMEVFSHEGRTLLAVNNEYTNRDILWGNNPDKKPASDDRHCQGQDGPRRDGHGSWPTAQSGWSLVKDSPFNRRITPDDRNGADRPGRRS